jgi:hypothetical protein
VERCRNQGRHADNIKAAYIKAFQYAIKQKSMDDVRIARGQTHRQGRDDARKVINTCDSAACWMLQDLGLTVKSLKSSKFPDILNNCLTFCSARAAEGCQRLSG